MITREFDYTADEFNADKPVQMATLEWSTVDENGYYYRTGRCYASFLVDAAE